jgi:hypothetical protein
MPDDVRFHYFRDDHRRPLVTLCRLVREGVAAYGWSVTSAEDNPDTWLGRHLALMRAKWAFSKAGRWSYLSSRVWGRGIQRPEAIDILVRCEAQTVQTLANERRFDACFPMHMMPRTEGSSHAAAQ